MASDQQKEPTLQDEDQAGQLMPAYSPTRRSFIEVLVDPRTLQRLMVSGGGLLALGLVVWLWSAGVFEYPLVVACCLGAVNLLVLAGGIAAVHLSRYQTAGKALTLLACLVMPLNLWFYDAQGLVTLAEGGHLWIPALVCCVAYVVVARELADPKFAYAIVGGITMTGMLFLADRDIGRFWEVMAPSAFLVVLGIISIHAERAFEPGAGPFSRERFGRAFFHAGHVVMAAGLVLLVGSRLAGWLYDPMFANLGWFPLPAVATQANLKLLALALVLGSAYSYVYSQLVVAAHGRYVASAVLTMLWSGVIVLDLLAIPFSIELVALLLAAAALVANLAAQLTRNHECETVATWRLTALVAPFRRVGLELAAGLNLIALALGALLYARARFDFLGLSTQFEFSWMYVAAMSATAVGWAWTAALARRVGVTRLAQLTIIGLAISPLFVASALLALVGGPLTLATLCLGMLLPLAIASWAFLQSSQSTCEYGARVAEIAATFMLLVGGGAVAGLIDTMPVAAPNAWLLLFFTEAALAFGLVSMRAKRITPCVMVVLAVCAAVCQLMLLVGVTRYVFILATTLVGIIGLATGAISHRGTQVPPRLALVADWTGRLAVSFGGLSAILLTFGRVLVSETEWTQVGLLTFQMSAAVVAMFLSRRPGWRRHFYLLAAVELLMTLLVVNSLSSFTLAQRTEVMLTLAGLAMFVAGRIGLSRESKSEDPLVGFNLACGSFLASLPLVVGLVIQRFGGNAGAWGWVVVHEAGTLAIRLLLLAVGVLGRLRWSTIAGGGTLVVYIVSLVGLIRLPDRLQTTAVYMMVGGGAFFLSALLLSIYRDRLLALPQKAREGKGVFQVLRWR